MNNTLTQFCQVYKNALTPEQCQTLISYFDASETHWSAVTRSDGEYEVDLIQKRIQQIRLRSGDAEQKELDDILFKSTGAILEQYITSVNDFYPMAQLDYGYHLHCYEQGEGFWDWHTDASVGVESRRTLGIIWHLNTITEGGETEFAWGKQIKPKQGMALVFPANWLYPHRANVPVSGSKYTATTWIGF